MCGICGIVKFRNGSPDPKIIRCMLSTIRHRGPDGSGMYVDNMAALGHVRLSIIDLQGGSQPMSNESGTLWLSFNGEVFNYQELKEILVSKGHFFRTSSDSEVIIHAWEEWGSESLNRFNGQWGFALWDNEKGELVLSVDPYGIRPVFYSMSGDNLVFASEIKAILQYPGHERRISTDGIADVYTTWGLTSERTCFEGVFRLMPGTWLRYNRNGIHVSSYRASELTEPGICSEKNYVDKVREALLNAVNLRFTRSDVPVGAYLSGGLDSSIIVSLITSHTDIDLKTFSIRFGDNEYDEGRYQQTLASDLGTDHQSVLVHEHEMMKAFPDVVYHTEQPLLRTAPIPMFLLSRLVRDNGYKVVVTGEGADEFFAGYDIYRETAVRTMILEEAPESEISAALNNLYPWMMRSPGKTQGMGRSFFERNLSADDPFMSHRTRWDNGRPLLSMLNPDIFTSGECESSIAVPSAFSDWSPLFKAQWMEIRTLLNGYLLSAQGDRMLMANSIEGRFPFLDPTVTKLANSLPDNTKLTGNLIEKDILKKAFGKYVPERIVHRPKQPYRAPDAGALFSDQPQPWMSELMEEKYIADTGLFQTPVVMGLFSKCRRHSGTRMSNRDNMMAVAAVSTLLLHDVFIRNKQTADELEPDFVISGKSSSFIP